MRQIRITVVEGDKARNRLDSGVFKYCRSRAKREDRLIVDRLDEDIERVRQARVVVIARGHSAGVETIVLQHGVVTGGAGGIGSQSKEQIRMRDYRADGVWCLCSADQRERLRSHIHTASRRLTA